ncbi:contact-dependent growth inhibition system immunity protein [Lihuaxuella thermophila]|uniref:CdiI immunity protein domain-containing protein n=1 Tax=Lihuaxuella thermophila TaxID=1173111 RepID=A0A1H8HS99_9BACL|nr:contact-dependent growth inhibition system immunity protein [Lihuaxuella thermophila]SEN58994.1 hypothetical protein SAMN05444955_11518 [Lihuaxuella thermophila]
MYKEDVLVQFLSGTFHQDISTPEEALAEFLREEDREWISEVADQIAKFLNSGISDEEKDAFIRAHTYIYFPYYNIQPVQWLEQVLEQLRKGLDSGG